VNSECFETVFEAVIVGAGFGGIGAAIQLKRLGYENFVILDREADLGTVDGRKDVIDALVLATGFDVWDANFPAIEVIGRQGRNLGKWWRENRFQAYQGVSAPCLPNLLNLVSPYASSGLSFFNTIEYQMRHMDEYQMRHMDRLPGEVKRRGASTFEVTEEANARFLDRMTQLLGDSVFRWATVRRRGRTTSTPALKQRCCGRRPHETRCGKPRPSRCATTRSPNAAAPSRQYRPDELGA
jgi:cation diffusion facilitator CzcD-associated flavoprotein CzcO